MMTRSFLAALACLSLSIPAAAQQLQPFPDQIRTSRSAGQANITGTRVYLTVPAGFKVSKTLPVVEKGEIGLIQAMDLDGGNFYSNAANFTRENFQKKGANVLEFKTLRLNGFPAKLSLMQGDAQTSVYNLVFGDSSFSTLVVGVFPTADTLTGREVRSALLSLYYDKASKVDPFAAAPFSLDDRKSAFRFAKFSASMYVYSLGGVKKTSYENEPYMLVVALPAEGTSIKAVCDNLAKSMEPFTEKNLVVGKTAGNPSLKRELYTTQAGKPILLFQHAVQLGASIVVMQGMAQSDFQRNLQEFQKLTNTVRKK